MNKFTQPNIKPRVKAKLYWFLDQKLEPEVFQYITEATQCVIDGHFNDAEEWLDMAATLMPNYENHHPQET